MSVLFSFEVDETAVDDVMIGIDVSTVGRKL